MQTFPQYANDAPTADGSSPIIRLLIAAVGLSLVALSAPAYAAYSGYRLFSIDHTKVGTADSTNFTVLLSGTFAEFATTANGGKVNNTVTCGIYSITCPADLIFTERCPLSESPLAGWEFEQYTATSGQMTCVGYRPNAFPYGQYIHLRLRRAIPLLPRFKAELRAPLSTANTKVCLSSYMRQDDSSSGEQ
jgi:hypothetical protein